jgi:hypothetical protein
MNALRVRIYKHVHQYIKFRSPAELMFGCRRPRWCWILFFYLQLVPSHAVYMANNQSISQSAVLFGAFMSVNTPHGGVFKASPMYTAYMVCAGSSSG